MLDDDQADAAAHEVLALVLGRTERLTPVPSRSHRVYLGRGVVLKVIDADNHDRMNREIALEADLPVGLSIPILASGIFVSSAGRVRYACSVRLPGTPPPDDLAGIDRATALRWAGQAVEKLDQLHCWTPGPSTSDVLRQPLDHGGFSGRERLLIMLEEAGSSGQLDAVTLAGLTRIATNAPSEAASEIPVHADCYWANWLVHDDEIIALLDFEWARFGEPADDWMFLARFSGEHLAAVLALIATETGTDLDSLRCACELRETSHVLADLLPALGVIDKNPRARLVAEELMGELRKVVTERHWWQAER